MGNVKNVMMINILKMENVMIVIMRSYMATHRVERDNRSIKLNINISELSIR